MRIIKIIFTLGIVMLCGLVPACEGKNVEDATTRFEYLNIDWWKKFNDAQLIEYINLAYKYNQDLKIAALNTKQAQETVKQSFANQSPQSGFYPEISRTFRSSNINHGSLIIPDYAQSGFFLPIDMSYELDIWGENYLKTKSLKKWVQMAQEDERAVYISLTSAVAADYFNLLKANELIKAQKKLLELQTRIVKMTEIKYENGLCPITEVIFEKQAFTELEETYELYKNIAKLLENKLVVLLGDRNLVNPILGDFETAVIPEIPEYISAEVIQNRPDLLRSEDYIQKIGIDVKVARRDFLPKFRIYGQVGFNAYSLNSIFTNNTFRALAGVLPSLDIFTGGAKISRLRYSKLEYEKAQQIYEKTILTSIQEVNDSLHSAKTSFKNFNSSLERYNLEQQKFSLMSDKKYIGALSELEFLKSEEALIVAEINKISNKTDCIISTINIYKSTGGSDYTNFKETL